VAAPNVKDFATGLITVAPSPADSGTSLTVQTGQGTLFPTTPFDAVVVPEGELPTIDNAEIITVTDVTSNVFTITRAQGVSSAKNIGVGWRIYGHVAASHVTGAYSRANHTGAQAIATVTGLQTALDSKATPADITTAINALINSAPSQLDTLNELAAALGNDANFASTVTAAIAAKATLALYLDQSSFPATGAANTLYISRTTWQQFVWSSGQYQEVSVSKIVGGSDYDMPYMRDGYLQNALNFTFDGSTLTVPNGKVIGDLELHSSTHHTGNAEIIAAGSVRWEMADDNTPFKIEFPSRDVLYADPSQFKIGSPLNQVDTSSGHAAVSSTGALSTDRTFSYPDKDGTFAMLDDITGGVSPSVFDVRDFGAAADNSTDDKVAIDLAIAAARTAYTMSGIVPRVWFSGGTYLTSGGHTVWSNMVYDLGWSTLRLKNGSNTDLLVVNDFSSLTGSGLPAVTADEDILTNPLGIGEGNFMVCNGFLQGNKANQSSTSNGIRIYGYNFFLANLFVTDFKTDGIYTEWGSLGSLTAPTNNMEGTLQNCKSSSNGGKGFNINGPHDSRLNNCYAYGNTSNQFYTGGGTAGAAGTWFTHCHGYKNSTTDVATVEFDAISCVWQNSNAEASSGTVGVRILRNDCRIEGGGEVIDPESGNTIGVQLGDATHQVANCTVDTKIHTCDNSAVYIYNSGGYNYVYPKVFQDGGIAFTGTTAIGDFVQPKEGSQIYGIPTGCVTVTGTQCPAMLFPDPAGTGNWIKLGDWYAANGAGGGSRLNITIVGTGGYNADADTVGQTNIQIATGNTSPAPNAQGVWGTQNGNAIISAVKLKQGATSTTWEVYVYAVASYTGNSYVRAETGSAKFPTSFVFSLATGQADPGAASSTVAVLTERNGFTSPISAASITTREFYVTSPSVAAAVFSGVGDADQFANFVLSDGNSIGGASNHYYAFSHRANHDLLIFNWNGSSFTDTFRLTEAGVLNVASSYTANGVAVPTISSTHTLTNKTISGASNTLSNIPESAVTNLTSDLAAKEATANKGVAGGYASLDGGGKVPVGQLPSSIMEYQGVWNASTNTPTLIDGTGSAGDVYRVTAAASRNLGSGSIAFDVGDYVIYNGTTWEKSDTTDAVASVNGYTGIVSLTKTDLSLGNVDNTSDATKNSAVAVLTNKTISGASNTLTNIAESSVTNLTSDLAGKVATTRSVSTSGSLTGGGDLSADRTISLVNDNATPGNSYYYGTNASGTKGFYTLPSGLTQGKVNAVAQHKANLFNY
jgi:hypothetical protein